MSGRQLATAALIVLATVTQVQSAGPAESIDANNMAGRLGPHPRLLLTTERLKELKATYEKDATLRGGVDEFLKLAELYLVPTENPIRPQNGRWIGLAASVTRVSADDRSRPGMPMVSRC